MIRPLTEDMKSIGADIVRLLDCTIDRPTSAFWVYHENNWHLTLATITARVDSPVDRDPVMRRIVEKINGLYQEDIKIALTAPANIMICNIFSVFKTGKFDIVGKFMHNTSDSTEEGTVVYIYRLWMVDSDFNDRMFELNNSYSAAVAILRSPGARVNISRNFATGFGAGIIVDSPMAPGSVINNNMMITSGVGYSLAGLNRSIFSNNTALKYSGGRYMSESKGFKIGKIENSKFSGNTSEGHDIGFEIEEIKDSEFNDNIAIEKETAILISNINSKIDLLSKDYHLVEGTDQSIELLTEIRDTIKNNGQSKKRISYLNDKLIELANLTAGGVLSGVGLDIIHRGISGFLTGSF